MHELSIAMNIVDTLGEELAGESGKVAAVRVEVGVLSGVVPDALLFAWEAASNGSRLEGSRLEIQEKKAVVHCPYCGGDKELPAIDRLRCPDCDAFTPDLVSGRELRIREVELA